MNLKRFSSIKTFNSYAQRILNLNRLSLNYFDNLTNFEEARS